jgi:hypothetical protein
VIGTDRHEIKSSVSLYLGTATRKNATPGVHRVRLVDDLGLGMILFALKASSPIDLSQENAVLQEVRSVYQCNKSGAATAAYAGSCA